MSSLASHARSSCVDQTLRAIVSSPGGANEQARLTLTWALAQVCFDALGQVAMMAAEVRESHGVAGGGTGGDQPPPQLSHGAVEELGPLRVAVVTFDEPKTVQEIPGGHRSGPVGGPALGLACPGA